MKELSEVTIVYAEDDIITRQEIARFLRRRVAEVYEADNGQDGLELIEKHQPDIVLTDIEMPVMNGIEMIKKVRDEFKSDRPIIVITGYDDDEHRTELANAYVYKPIQYRKILELISDLLVSK